MSLKKAIFVLRRLDRQRVNAISTKFKGAEIAGHVGQTLVLRVGLLALSRMKDSELLKLARDVEAEGDE